LDRIFVIITASKAKLEIKEDRQRGIFIQNCTELSVSSAENMLRTMDTGSQNRKVAFTGMNERSSRSHSLFIVHLSQKNLKKDNTKQSKLYFVDLAGSEKVSKTGVMGQQLEEAKNINKSLSALGNVIHALTSEKKEHVPYRDSKLTRILQESLGGNSKTTLIINCSMCTYNDK
jgi:kinesin family protein 5